MSKRFGRNQKRRMREEIAEKESLCKTTFELMKLHRDKACENGRRVMELEDEIQDAKDVLGANFIGFRLTDETKQHIRGAYIDSTLQYPVPPGYEALSLNPLQNEQEVMRHVPLNVLALSIDREAYRDMMHIRLHVDGAKRVAYALSGMQLKSMPRGVLLKRLSEEFARLSVSEMAAEKLF